MLRPSGDLASEAFPQDGISHGHDGPHADVSLDSTNRLPPARSKHAMATLKAPSSSPVFLAEAAKIDSAIRGPSSHTFGSISKGLPTSSTPTLLPGSASLGISNGTQDIIMTEDSLPRSLRASSSSGSRPPIFAKITDVPQARPRPRVNLDLSARRWAREIQYCHSRYSSEPSLASFNSFGEVRRGFEFSSDLIVHFTLRLKHDSLLSIASVSSNGGALNCGLKSTSMPVDHTLLFLDRQPKRHSESDACSFYFRYPTHADIVITSPTCLSCPKPHLSACTIKVSVPTSHCPLPYRFHLECAVSGFIIRDARS
ncbi:hypothetical protein Hypma_002254 [Hypsizygus marmoreus]|uniref:Uncharacterized protein n=1 Tax=Hypsizygus marmoreus TaxID=39966 RepID=A0A369K1P9_HYPMA|nr:hypothetical protein Hypma_002254 [Hypsizygus marmoreus]